MREVDEREGGSGVGFLGVLLEPLADDLVPAPVTADELGGREFLEDVAGMLIEDREESL